MQETRRWPEYLRELSVTSTLPRARGRTGALSDHIIIFRARRRRWREVCWHIRHHQAGVTRMRDDGGGTAMSAPAFATTRADMSAGLSEASDSSTMELRGWRYKARTPAACDVTASRPKSTYGYGSCRGRFAASSACSAAATPARGRFTPAEVPTSRSSSTGATPPAAAALEPVSRAAGFSESSVCARFRAGVVNTSWRTLRGLGAQPNARRCACSTKL